MVLKRQIIALGAIVLVGGILLPLDEAMAFGQQWRPDPAYGPGNGANFRQTANVPSFRPHSAARPAIARDALSMRRPAYAQRRYGGYPAPYFAPRQVYPMGRMYQVGPMGGFLPPPGHLAAAYPQSAWAPSFVPVASPWGQRMPLFARQFHWRPARQPWMAQAPAPRWQDYRARATPWTAQQHSVRAAYPPAAGSWRPAAVPAQHFAVRSPAYAQFQRPRFGSGGLANPVRSMRSVGVAAPPPVMPRSYWRPQVAAQPGTRSSVHAFRPNGYGRRPSAGARLAARGSGGGGFTRDGLPGWVTTYQDAAVEDPCNWCSGS